MLRISVLNDPETTRMKLEGKLAHEWVSELEKAWSVVAAVKRARKVIVDLLGVSFVDDSGRELLAAMHKSGVELIGSGPLVSSLIAEIQAAGSTQSQFAEEK